MTRTEQLPPAPMRAWSSDTLQRLGGVMIMAGVDPDEALRVRSIPDHPWVGLTVVFPFSEVGRGKIVKCLTHPSGQLLFDVDFPEPVPMVGGYRGKYCCLLVEDKHYYHQTQRFSAEELKEIIDGETTTNEKGESA